jgi:ABC-type amino acid transport substrate-binding protein
VSPRSALDAVIESVGTTVACLIGIAATVAAVLVALGLPAQSFADDAPAAPAAQPRPDLLVVALDLRNPVRQAGAVRGGEIILARGLEVDIAKELARRLHVPRIKFIHVPTASRLPSTTARPWHLVIASLKPTSSSVARADLSRPYIGDDQAVVLRKGLPPLRALSDLGGMVVCAVRGSNGARALASAVPVSARPRLAPSTPRLLELAQTGVCDASLVDADLVGRLVAGRGGMFGPVTSRVPFGEGSVVAVGRDGPVTVAAVDRALTRMRADGTMHRIARAWLGIDPGRLISLR